MTSASAPRPQEFRARVVMTRADHASGTDRVAEAASASERSDHRQHSRRRADDRSGGHRRGGARRCWTTTRTFPWARSRSASSGRPKFTDPNVVKVVTDRAGQRDVFFALADSVSRANPASEPRVFQAHRACTCTAAIFCWPIRICRWARWNAPSAWNNCARSKTDSRFAWWKPSMNRWASIRPKIGTRVAALYEKLMVTG